MYFTSEFYGIPNEATGVVIRNHCFFMFDTYKNYIKLTL